MPVVEGARLVIVDGKQRLEAVRAFLRGDIAVFGKKISEFEGKMPLDYTIEVAISNLEKESDVISWYLAINRGGTPHSDSEISRVEALRNNLIEKGS